MAVGTTGTAAAVVAVGRLGGCGCLRRGAGVSVAGSGVSVRAGGCHGTGVSVGSTTIASAVAVLRAASLVA